MRYAIINPIDSTTWAIGNIVLGSGPADDSWIDITDLVPQPGVGWTTDDRAFFVPPVVVVVPSGVPEAVTMRQARLALLGAGKLAAVAPAIAALPQPQRAAAEIEWEFSSVVERHRPFVVSLGAALGLDDAALDALFIAAGKL